MTLLEVRKEEIRSDEASLALISDRFDRYKFARSFDQPTANLGRGDKLE
ncbi:hypothetical protein B2J93_3047 [Marssonina coronariae]|uniref:Uncharacterized protein n=1 Tax=Diplocarpon coronariae TaxID=2795749 RepID=A0A218ZI19_9HELO|nr:hypothetical protein B2J93_3047 [Marssonina coronariae]